MTFVIAISIILLVCLLCLVVVIWSPVFLAVSTFIVPCYLLMLLVRFRALRDLPRHILALTLFPFIPIVFGFYDNWWLHLDANGWFHIDSKTTFPSPSPLYFGVVIPSAFYTFLVFWRRKKLAQYTSIYETVLLPMALMFMTLLVCMFFIDGLGFNQPKCIKW